MKKIISLSLLTALMAVSIAGCGADKEAVDAGAENVATQSDYEQLKANGKAVVGITMFNPMNYYDENKELVGFDTELAKAVFEKLGLEAEFLEINWDSKEVELNSRNIDCIWNGMCITEDRKTTMGITEPYLNNTQAMVMKPDVAQALAKDPSGANVVAEQGSTGEGKLQGTIADDESVKVSAKEFFANSNYTAVDSMAKAIMEVAAGTADIALVDSVCAYGMVGEGTDYPDLVVNIDNEFGAQQYGIAFRKGSDLVEMVNTAIDELRADGTVEKIAEKYNLSSMLIK